jgi:superfamily II DNA/RNA helicase
LVLDEFDALLEYKPHRDPTRAIITTLKKRHGDSLQTILCSATASDMIGSKKLENFLRPGFVQAMADRNDRLITASDDVADATRVSSTAIHGVIHVPHRRLALETLRSILYTEPTPQQVLIFADNARRVDIVIEKVRDDDACVSTLSIPFRRSYSHFGILVFLLNSWQRWV